MTLRPYEPHQLDDLSLRLVDLCGRLRRMAERCRDEDLDSIPLNDKKAIEWLENLEVWVQKAEGSFERTLTRHRAAQVAERMQRQREKRERERSGK
jgi:hypothetical protein